MEEFRKKLLNLVNQAELPPEAIFYVVKDFYRDLVESYNSYLAEVERRKAEAAAAQQIKEEE